MVTPVVVRTLLIGFVVLAIGAVGLGSLDLIGPVSQSAAAVTYAVGAVLVAKYWHSRSFGAANGVTLTRLIGTSWIAALVVATAVVEPGSELRRAVIVVMIVVGSVCLVLDNVDGRLARGRGEVSDFGARFDMETDAAMLLFLCVAVPLVGVAGWWVLAIGLMRYVYVAVSWIVPALRIPIPPSYARKAVAAIQGVALLLALALSLVDGIPGWIPGAVVALALASLCWSFGSCVIWQLGQAAESTPAAASRAEPGPTTPA